MKSFFTFTFWSHLKKVLWITGAWTVLSVILFLADYRNMLRTLEQLGKLDCL